MRLTLIYPNLGCTADGRYIDEGRMEPLTLGVIAGLTPQDVEVVLYDDRIEEIRYDEPTDLVAITAESFTARRAYEISAEFRQRGVPVILGGMHPTLVPEEAAAHADSVYVGDAEALWPQVIADARHRKLQPLYRGRPGIPQPGFFPRRDIFRGKGYLPLSLIQFGRGCRYECEFCAVSVYFGHTQYRRPVREVVQEVEAQERKYLFFVDDNVLSDHEAAKELCRELIPLKVHWVSQGSIDMTEDRELMELMARSGCLGHVIGFESIDAEDLRTMGKRSNLSQGFAGYKPQLQVLREYGLQTWAAFVLGYDHDTPASIERTLEFALESKFGFAAFNVLMPYPNTPLYRRLQAEGRLLYGGKWWLDPEYRFNCAAFRPRLMSADQLTEAGLHARTVYNRFGSIFRRALDFKTHLRSPLRLFIYLLYNPLFRRETFRKHGMRLGLHEEGG